MDLQIFSIVKDLGLGGLSIYLLYSLIKNKKNGNNSKCDIESIIKSLDCLHNEIKALKEYEIEKLVKIEQALSLLVDKLINGK